MCSLDLWRESRLSHRECLKGSVSRPCTCTVGLKENFPTSDPRTHTHTHTHTCRHTLSERLCRQEPKELAETPVCWSLPTMVKELLSDSAWALFSMGHQICVIPNGELLANCPKLYSTQGSTSRKWVPRPLHQRLSHLVSEIERATCLIPWCVMNEHQVRTVKESLLALCDLCESYPHRGHSDGRALQSGADV